MISILVTLFLLVMIVTFVVELLVPQLQKTFETLVVTVPAFAKRSVDKLMAFLELHPELYEMVSSNVSELENMDWTSLIQKAAKLVGDSISSLAEGAFSAIGSVSSFLITTFVSVAFSLYCLGRKEILAVQGRMLLYSILPERWVDEIVRVMRLTNTRAFRGHRRS